MTIRVRMTPHLEDVNGESGIVTIIRKYFQHLPNYGIELVGRKEDSFDILAVHAGTSGKYPLDARTVAHCHGLSFSAEYPALSWEWAANEAVITSLLRADQITVTIGLIGMRERAAQLGGEISFGGGGQTAQTALITVTLATRDQREESIWAIGDRWRSALAAMPGFRSVQVYEFGATPMSTSRAPISEGCRFPWKSTYRRTQST